MAFRRVIPLLSLAALPLAAATIVDVSHQTRIRLYTGDALRFTIPASNFAADAAMLRSPAAPTALAFQLISAPVTGAGQFLATVESSDGDLSIPRATPLSFVSAQFHGSRYSGPASSLGGSFSFSRAESAELFAGSGAVLILFNTGPAVTVGLAPYTFPQDLEATLTNGALSVGVLPRAVGYVDPPQPGAAVPEPAPGVLLFSGGTALCLLSAVLRRVAGCR